MDKTFVPGKPSTLVVRVKIAASLPDDVLPQESDTEFNGFAIFILVSVVLLILGGGYFYFSNGSVEEERDSVLLISQNEISPPPVVAFLPSTPEEIPTDSQSNPLIPVTLDQEALVQEIVTEMSLADPVTEKPSAVIGEVIAPKPIPEVLPKSSPEPVANRSSVYVTRAQFTHGVQQREPIDLIDGIMPDESPAIANIFFFTELKNLKGQTIRHSWFHESTLISEIKFHVRGNRWRVNSSKRLNHTALGSWQVKVMNEEDEVLLAREFVYE